MERIKHLALPTVGLLALWLAGCAAVPPPQGASPGASTTAEVSACPVTTNCVSSVGGAGTLPALNYPGTAAQAHTALLATLASYPQARIVRDEPTFVEAVFTTPAGFQDVVQFQLAGQSKRIDFKSQSTLGLFDFGKNRSRMQEFGERFQKQLAQ